MLSCTNLPLPSPYTSLEHGLEAPNHILSVCACSFSGCSHDDNTVAQGYKTAAAGGIVVCVCNYVFMFVFGSEEESSSEQSSPPEKA